MVKAMDQRKYYAFISYCHKDKAKARRLYNRLQRYRLPSSIIREQKVKRGVTLPERLTPVFIDDEEMMGTSVRQGMQRGLSQSRFLVVVCSPNSAKSTYVNYELEYFIQDGRGDHIIPYIIQGSPCSGDPAVECYPPAIRKQDILGADEQQLKEDALLRVIATIIDVDMGVLSRKNKQRKIIQIICSAALVILLLVSLLLYSNDMKQRIVDQHRLMLASEAKRLTASAVDEDVDMDLSILLTRQACEYLPEEQVEDSDALVAFRSAVIKRSVAEARDYLIPAHTLTFNTKDIEIGRSYADGRRLACRMGEQTCLYDIESGECVFSHENRNVFFSPDATWCIVTSVEENKRIAMGMEVPSGKMLFKTAPREFSVMWSFLPDVVIFEDDGSAAYLVSSEGPDVEPVEGVTRNGDVTRYDTVPRKVQQVYAALESKTTWYNMALTSACYTVPHILRQAEDPLRNDLVAQGYSIEDAQIYPEQGLLIYQCRSNKEGDGETLLYFLETGKLCCAIPGQAYYDTSNGCIYAKNSETVRIYRTIPANMNVDVPRDSTLLCGINRDGSRFFSLTRTGDGLNGIQSPGKNVQKVQIRSVQDNSVVFSGELYVPQTDTCLCYIDEDMNGLLYLDGEGVFHYFDTVNGRERFSWRAEDAESVSALCFNEEEGLIAVALILENDEPGDHPFLYQIELRDMERGELLETCDITEQLDLDYLGIDITTVRLLNEKLLVGTARRSCLIDVIDRRIETRSCISFDSMQGNSSNPLCAQLTKDGLLFFTTDDVNNGSMQCLNGIYDIERNKVVLRYPDSTLFAYDAENGMLVCQALTADGDLISSVKIYQRQADGDFQNIGEIMSSHPDMTIRSGQSALDRGYLLLENDSCTEIFRLEDGRRMLWLDDTGFALRNGMAYDINPYQSFGFSYDYRLDYAHVRALSERLLKTSEGARNFTAVELEKYYIVQNEGQDNADPPQ